MSPARAREPCISKAGDKGDVPVNRASLAVVRVFDDGVNRHFWHSANGKLTATSRNSHSRRFAIPGFGTSKG